jgi:hypothetical protein
MIAKIGFTSLSKNIGMDSSAAAHDNNKDTRSK